MTIWINCLPRGKLEPIKAVRQEFDRRLDGKAKAAPELFPEKTSRRAAQSRGSPGHILLVYHVKPVSRALKAGREAAGVSEEIQTTPITRRV